MLNLNYIIFVVCCILVFFFSVKFNKKWLLMWDLLMGKLVFLIPFYNERLIMFCVISLNALCDLLLYISCLVASWIHFMDGFLNQWWILCLSLWVTSVVTVEWRIPWSQAMLFSAGIVVTESFTRSAPVALSSMKLVKKIMRTMTSSHCESF